MITSLPRWFPAPIRRAAFTLVEVLIAASLALLVVGAVMSVVVMVAKSVRKSQLLEEALRNTREVQDHITREISIAVSSEARQRDRTAPYIGMRGVTSDGATPDPHFAQLVYQIPVGNPVPVGGAIPTPPSSTSLVVVCPPDVTPEPGDYVMLKSPNTLAQLRVFGPPDDPAPGTNREVTLHFETSIAAAAARALTNMTKPILDGAGRTIGFTYESVEPVTTFVAIYRERKYVVAAPAAGADVTQLQWWANASNDAVVRTLSRNVGATQRYMFKEVKEGIEPDDKVVALNWRFRYVGLDAASAIMGGNRQFWEVNQTAGELRARSGDPLATGKTDYFQGTTIRTTTSVSTTVPTTTIATTKSTTSSVSSTTVPTTTSTTVPTTTRVTTTSTTVPTTKSTTVPTTTRVTTKSTTVPTTTRVTTVKTTIVTTKSTSVPTTKSTTSSVPTTKSTTSSVATTKSTTVATTTKASTVPTTTIKQDSN